jgi:hypothetical protein
MAKAIRYSLNQWDALTLILRDGRACSATIRMVVCVNQDGDCRG